MPFSVKTVVKFSHLFFIAVILLLGTGCSTAYYSAMEKLGIQKREILVDRVSDAKRYQQKGQEEFKDALDQFRSLVQMEESDLEKKYDITRKAYEDSKSAAEDISESIDDIESVANALFKEWKKEITQYESANLKRESEKRLRETESKYAKLIMVMQDSEASLEPALRVMNDQVLYLKHNLNAQAIGSLEQEFSIIDRDINTLLVQMEQSIAEADSFIASMR